MQQLRRVSLLILALAMTTGCGSGGGAKDSGTKEGDTGAPDGEGTEEIDLTNLPEWTKDGNTYFFPTSSNIPPSIRRRFRIPPPTASAIRSSTRSSPSMTI